MTYTVVTHCLDCGRALARESDRYCGWCLRRRASAFWIQWEWRVRTGDLPGRREEWRESA